MLKNIFFISLIIPVIGYALVLDNFEKYSSIDELTQTSVFEAPFTYGSNTNSPDKGKAKLYLNKTDSFEGNKCLEVSVGDYELRYRYLNIKPLEKSWNWKQYNTLRFYCKGDFDLQISIHDQYVPRVVLQQKIKNSLDDNWKCVLVDISSMDRGAIKLLQFAIYNNTREGTRALFDDFQLLENSLYDAYDDIIISDFEGKAYDDKWQIIGEAFGKGPAQKEVSKQGKVSGFIGKGFANSYYGKNYNSISKLISPNFIIKRDYINFLIGGGNYNAKTCVNLLINDEIVRTQTGRQSESLKLHQWDVNDYIGKEAQIEIVDDHYGPYGHITVDQITQSNKPLWTNISLKFTAEKKYLNIPVSNKEISQEATVYVNGNKDHYFALQLADQGEEDFWVYMSLNTYKGKEIELKINRGSAFVDENTISSIAKGMPWTIITKNGVYYKAEQFVNDVLARLKAFDNCYQSDKPKEYASFYKEKNRPAFHYTSKRGWQNDANGLVYYNGEFHLYYQHNPYGRGWAAMHWGHAVSKDLIHWEQLDVALKPSELGPVWSGSAVVDKNNTSGFQKGNEPPIIAFYTAAGWLSQNKDLKFTQCLAFSNDRGRTFTNYELNPIIKNIERNDRDPKVFWYEPTYKWIMALYLDKNIYTIFSSSNLKDWDRMSDVELGGRGECPELFPLAVDGKRDDVKWVFWGADSSYRIGTFDGNTFHPETDTLKCYNAGNAYAGQTFNNIPDSDGRRILMAWMRYGSFPDMPFNQQMSFPVELTLKSTNEGLRVCALPIREIKQLYDTKYSIADLSFDGEFKFPDKTLNSGLDILAEFQIIDNNAVFGIEINGEKFSYNSKNNTLNIRGNAIIKDENITLKTNQNKIEMRILVDKTSVEFFSDNGNIYVPYSIVPKNKGIDLNIFSENGKTKLIRFDINELKSIWD